jgi:adenosylhomocysteine nucleosidase
MRKIAIIAAMEEEINEIKKIMNNITEKNIYELKILEGTIQSKECILLKCEVGKVNAARCTQILIDNYEIEYVVNIGSAGAGSDDLSIGDIVIGKTLVQHDFDITAFGHKKGYISNIGENISSDKNLIDKFEAVINNIENKEFNIKIGTIASGDIFCNDINMKEKINYKFNADAIEMEGAAIAQVCYLDNVPFIVIRSISDTPNGSNEITFEQYLKLASKRCASILYEFLCA